MKFLFHNDKSTIKDELFLLMFIVICIGAGVLFYIFAPNDWIISNSTIKVFGVAWILAGVHLSLVHKQYRSKEEIIC